MVGGAVWGARVGSQQLVSGLGQNRKTFRVLKPKRINLINYNHVLLETYEDDDDVEDDAGPGG